MTRLPRNRRSDPLSDKKPRHELIESSNSTLRLAKVSSKSPDTRLPLVIPSQSAGDSLQPRTLRLVASIVDVLVELLGLN